MYLKLIDILICPECKSKQFELQKTILQKEEIWIGEIHCVSCNRIYPIIDGIPCMLSKEQLEAQDGPIMQEWLQKLKDVELNIIDENQKTYKEICRSETEGDMISEDAKRLLWEKKLYFDNQILRNELGDKFEAKWAIAKDNIKLRNDYLFKFIEKSENFNWKEVLNIGPGIDSDLIERLKAKGIDIINCDINLDPLKHLKSKNITKKCIGADLKSLPFDDETFDVVFCFHVIHHVHPIEQALSEARRVLKPNGKIFITEVNVNHLVALQGRLFPDVLKRFIRRFVRQRTGTRERIYKPSPYEQIIASKVLINEMTKAGFIDILRRTAVHAPMCFSDNVINFWNKMGFRFPKLFDPIAFEYFFSGTKAVVD